MIGVLVQSTEQEVAREFFELCKTPWEFYQAGRSYDVLLCTAPPPSQPSTGLRLFFDTDPPGGDADDRIAVHRRPEGMVLSHEGRRIPLYGPAVTFPGGSPALLHDIASGEAALSVRVTAGATLIRVGYNLLEEIRHLLTVGQPVLHARSATLEHHVALVRDLITRAGIPLVEIPPVPFGHPSITCLTHDIDHPVLKNHRLDHTMLGFLYRATVGSLIQTCRGRLPVIRLCRNLLAAARLPLVHLGLAADFWRPFDRYVEIEAGRQSSFFVIPMRDHAGRSPDGVPAPKRACSYELAEVKPQLERIMRAGSEVGLHGLDAWFDADAGRREKEHLQDQIGPFQGGVRMHWLYFDQKHSPTALDDAGFTYDSTVGYNETVGYRAGTTQVYRPLGVRHLLELPLHVMDTSLFYPDYLNLSEEEARKQVTRMMDDVQGLGGVLTINWHDRSIAPERLWGDFYVWMLQELQIRGSWFATAADVVAWFRMRRSVAFESIHVETGKIKVRSRLTKLDTTLPGLRIRLHMPHDLIHGQPLATGPGPGHVDVPMQDAVDIPMTI